MVAAAVIIARHAQVSLDTLAAAVALLLIAGIRNAWDLILFIVAQPRAPL
jgi:hypothetical protein